MSLKLGKILLIRMDRIGDLVLTLPVDESLKTIDAKVDAQWWIPPGLGFVASHAVPARNVREIDSRFSSVRFRLLLDELKRDRPRVAVIFHAPWWVSVLLFMARVPVRAGPRSQWHHLLFLNRRIKQKRSRAEVNELEYNFRLMEGALRLGPRWLQRSHLVLQPPPNESVTQFGLEPGRYVVIHPGMGGSALNWPLPFYAQLISRLTEQTKVVVTGTRADAPYVSPIREMLTETPNVTWLDGKLKGSELLTVLRNAQAVVAPSTGVLHLAASVGAPTLGLFSPIRVQSSKRWGPQGDRTRVLAPPVTCPARHRCLGEKCKYFDCMQKITVSFVQKTLNEMAEQMPPVIG